MDLSFLPLELENIILNYKYQIDKTEKHDRCMKELKDNLIYYKNNSWLSLYHTKDRVREIKTERCNEIRFRNYSIDNIRKGIMTNIKKSKYNSVKITQSYFHSEF